MKRIWKLINKEYFIYKWINILNKKGNKKNNGIQLKQEIVNKKNNHHKV